MAWEREAEKPLYEAMQGGNLQKFRQLLQQYPDNLRNRNGLDTWLHMAARDGLLPFVELLVDLGVGVDEQDATQLESETALTTAAGNGHLDVVRWLLDHGAKLNYERQGRFYCPALIGAAIEGHPEVVRLLVERGADINGHTNGMNALMQAEMYGQPEVYEFLQSHGARDLRATTPADFPAS
ncbi:MAG: ankyrin repeat domain-containing protein, partial [Planctomycetaceae bacterium]|nr:ankyrin repeat domain-containing protein [Planctomycetaceae bacterium]